MADERRRTDYTLHSDEELREAIATAEQEESRIRAEDSPEALAAERTQRRAMEEELRRRGSRRVPGPVTAARSLAGLGLAGTAAGLALGAAATERMAELVRPRPGEPSRSRRRASRGGPASGGGSGGGRASGGAPASGGGSGGRGASSAESGRRRASGASEGSASDEPVTPPPAEPRTATAGEHGAVRTPPTADVPDTPTHQQASESHVAALAAGDADEVARRVPELSTDELHALQDYETGHQGRRTVLDAIERTAAAEARGGRSR